MGRETHLEVREGSGDPPGDPGRVGRSTRRSGKGRETHPEVRDGSRNPPGGPGWVVKPTRRSGKGRETHPKVREGSRDPPGVFGKKWESYPIMWRPTRTSGKVR